MKKIMSLLIAAVCIVGNLSIAATIPTAPSVTFGSISDPNTLNSTQFNKYDGSVFVKTSDGTANGSIGSVWHYSIKNNKWVKVPTGLTMNAVDSVFGRTGTITAQTGDYSWGQISNKPSFATAATTGDYSDLTNKPTIPSQYNPTAGAGISISGTYPNQTIANTSVNTDSQTLTSSTNTLSISGGNSAPIINSNSLALSGQTLTSTVNGVASSSSIAIFMRKPLTANVSSTAVVRANITDWSFPVTAGKSYRVEVVSTYQSAATTTGGSLGFVLSTGAGSIFGFMEGDTVNKTAATTLRQPIYAVNATNTTAGSFITTTGVGVINSPHSLYGVVTFNCTASGTFQAQWASEVSDSAAQLNTGSVMYVTEF